MGVCAGLAASVALSIILSFVFSQLTASSSREYLEGMIGIVAVVMMLTVGAWLHSKSNIHSWSRYIGDQMNQAIATGKLVSFALISFFSIFREGAETIIFYSGMAPYMSIKQMMVGIAVAIAILLVIGFIIIRYSVKLPITAFFKVATVIIYALSFKILGVSIHSLQVSQVLPTHTVHQIPFIEWIGLYPTLETTLPQISFVIVILLTSVVYSATKFAVRALTMGMEKELSKTGIRVTNISPGAVETELRDHITDEEVRANFANKTDRTLLQSEDIANVIVYAVTQPTYVNVNEITIRPKL